MKKSLKLLISSTILAITLSVSTAHAGYFKKANGDSPCQDGYTLLSPVEARANQNEICSQLGTWDIARLAHGGAMDGPGYGCQIRDEDTRSMGHSVCKKVESFVTREGDGYCEAGETLVSQLVADANRKAACEVLGPWYIVRLENEASMDGSGYGCGTRIYDAREAGQSLCATFEIQRTNGDTPCPAESSLVTPLDAEKNHDEICSSLGAWDIVRLAGGGSMDGPGYGCGMRENDTRTLGHSLCRSKYPE